MCSWVCVGKKMKERKGNLQVLKQTMSHKTNQSTVQYLYIPTYERPNPKCLPVKKNDLWCSERF